MTIKEEAMYDWEDLFFNVLVGLLGVAVIGLLVFVPLMLYRTTFETVVKGPSNGKYIVTGERIDRKLMLIYARTDNDEEVIIKFAPEKTDTPVSIATGYSVIVKVNNEHLVSVIEIPKESEVPSEVLNEQ